MQKLETDGTYFTLGNQGTETNSWYKATSWTGEEARFRTKEAAEWWLKLDNDHKEWKERKNAGVQKDEVGTVQGDQDGPERGASNNPHREAWRRI